VVNHSDNGTNSYGFQFYKYNPLASGTYHLTVSARNVSETGIFMVMATANVPFGASTTGHVNSGGYVGTPESNWTSLSAASTTPPTCANCDLSNLSKGDFKLDNLSLQSALLDNTSLNNGEFWSPEFDNVSADNFSIRNSFLDNLTILNSDFPNSSFDNTSIRGTLMRDSSFDNSTFSNTGLYNVDLDNISLVGANLSGLYFDTATGSTLDNVTCSTDTTLPSPTNLTCNANGFLAFNGTAVDDHADNFTAATTLPLGQIKVGYLAANDNDTFVFTLLTDNQTEIEFESNIAIKAMLDNGSVVNHSDNGTNPYGFQFYKYNPLASGTYHLTVSARNVSETGIFRVWVTPNVP
jgi:uncharacterized protein YjbI with pentapeptide repeats